MIVMFENYNPLIGTNIVLYILFSIKMEYLV